MTIDDYQKELMTGMQDSYKTWKSWKLKTKQKVFGKSWQSVKKSWKVLEIENPKMFLNFIFLF